VALNQDLKMIYSTADEHKFLEVLRRVMGKKEKILAVKQTWLRKFGQCMSNAFEAWPCII
jgi:hypothetical protein